MCNITLKCNKCAKVIESIKWKIKRNKKAIDKMPFESLNAERLKSENIGLEWIIKQLEKMKCLEI